MLRVCRTGSFASTCANPMSGRWIDLSSGAGATLRPRPLGLQGQHQSMATQAVAELTAMIRLIKRGGCKGRRRCCRNAVRAPDCQARLQPVQEASTRDGGAVIGECGRDGARLVWVSRQCACRLAHC